MDPLLVLSVLLPPRGTSQTFLLVGDTLTHGQTDGQGWTVSGTGQGTRGALLARGVLASQGAGGQS